MNLWTEYEGRTIDGVYPLTKLIQPEGRSAFFSTSNGTGVPTVIRLIESHFDGDEILTRWRGVAAMNHPNLVKLKRFGHVVVDETSLVYAVMEPVEANLGAILQERRLTHEETGQLATSLLAAVDSLHANGFVHEHVEPANVLAVGEEIKLRSDCIREAPEEQLGRDLKRKDVHDYAVVLLQALTQRKTLEEASRELPLPAPFEQIVRKGLSGEWGVAQIKAELTRKGIAKEPFRKTNTGKFAAASEVAAHEREKPVAAPAVPAAATPEARFDARPDARTIAPSVVPPPSVARRIPVAVDERRRGIGAKAIAYGVGILLILLLGWYFVHSRSASSGGTTQKSSAPSAVPERTAPAAADGGPVTAPGVSAVPAKVVPRTTESAPADRRGRWRVVAFTYNQEEQARQKAAAIAQQHPDLNPTVWTPNGHAPFLVTLGGQMSRENAFALSGKAKREGMPRDTYAQNYR